MAKSSDQYPPSSLLSPDSNQTTGGRAPRTRKTHAVVTISHWSMVILLALNLLTGMRLGWGYIDSWFGGPFGWWATALNAISPTGSLFGIDLITLHVSLAFLLLLNIGVYVIYLFRSRASKRLSVTRQDMSRLVDGVRSGGFWQNKRALWSANVLVYWAAFLFIGALVVTGVALYRVDWALATGLGGYDVMRWVHAFAAYLFLPYILLHVVLQWFFGNFWAIFKAQFYRPHLKAGLVGLLLTVPMVVGLYAWNERTETLDVPRLSGEMSAPILNGKPDDAVWDQAEPVVIRTVKGVNNPKDHVDVSVKAVHDGSQIYFQVQWDDPDVSFKRYPLLKTAKGWKVLQTEMETANESVFYEDKFSMYITAVDNGGCAETCHVGVGPDGVQKGVHFTAGEVGDVWHWKSVRTGPMNALENEPGYMDDQHFRTPDPIPDKPKKRYKAGYHADPKSGGGYRTNFVKLDSKKALADTYVQPILLPPTNKIKPNPDPATNEAGVKWWIHEKEGIPYTPEADTYAIGTLIPNILIKPIQGDRADVRAKGAWTDGTWTLEVSRVLNTGSDYDVPFSTEEPVYLSVAAFNRTQTRHSEHIKPVRVVLEP